MRESITLRFTKRHGTVQSVGLPAHYIDANYCPVVVALLIFHELAVDIVHFADDILLKAIIVSQLWTPTSDSSVEED